MRLAGEDEAGLKLPGFQRIVHRHRRRRPPPHCARQVLHIPPLQAKGRSIPARKRRVQHGLALRDRHVAAVAVHHQVGDVGGRGARGCHRAWAGHAAADAETKRSTCTRSAGMPSSDSTGSTASIIPAGPHRNTWSTCAAGTMWRSSSRTRSASMPAVEDRNILFLLAEYVEHGEAAEIAVFQLLQRLAEQHVRAPSGCRRTGRTGYAVRGRGCRALSDSTGVMPDPAASADINARRTQGRRPRRSARSASSPAPSWPGASDRVRPSGERPALHPLDRDAQLPVIGAGTDRV